jgi:hypothetical protein
MVGRRGSNVQASDELLTIAELAIGLTGFSGVVAAFTHRSGLGELERYLFVILFTVGLSAVFVAFVPFGFHDRGTAGPVLWFGSSVVALITGVGISVALFLAAPANHRATNPPGFLNGDVATVGIPLLSLGCHAFNIAGWPTESGPMLYVGGLLIWLLVAGANFLRLVLYGSVRE